MRELREGEGPALVPILIQMHSYAVWPFSGVINIPVVVQLCSGEPFMLLIFSQREEAESRAQIKRPPFPPACESQIT